MAGKKRDYFDTINPSEDFPQMEKDLLQEWKDKKIVEKYLQKNKASNKIFSFLDGPITANNPMGVHHAWGRTYKDLWQRFKNMQGYSQRFQNGFDCQGLWVEVEVEKQLGFKNKKDIEAFGVSKFVDACKARVKKYSDIQTNQSKRLGYFMDWENSYYTLSDNNNYAIWHFLKVANDNGWIYKGSDSVPWCPRCETAISQHEILTEDYKEISHKSIVLQFPIVGKKDEYLLVWTTTPWTIPANVAVAVDVDMDYAQVKGDGGELYWLAKEAIVRIFKKPIDPQKVVKGQDLVGLSYKGAFDDLPAVKKASENKLFHTIIPTDERIMPISTEEGTGMVHTAVSAGSEDFKLGQKLGLSMVPVINDDASYMQGLGFLVGKNAKQNPEIIFDYLKEEKEKYGKSWYFDIFPYKHRYPACWRCKEELVWKVTDEWYISMDRKSMENLKIKDQKSKVDGRTLRERMIGVTKHIKWLPKFGLKRELDWLDNMGDWLISKKNRYWGLALPIWECGKCGHFEVLGSYQELKERAVSGWNEFEGKSPHKPQIDKVKIKCTNCGQVVSRIEPVGNPWLDAGIVSFSTISKTNKATLFDKSTEEPLYFSDKKEWEKWFPADFITESFPGQFKNWFYSLIAMSTVLEDKNPFDTVLGHATLLGEDGRPMHKSWGNSIEFNEAADKIGVDVMRWMFVRQNPSDNLLFGIKTADETRRRFHLKLWNVYNFFVTYANLDGWKPDGVKDKKTTFTVLDFWMRLRMMETIRDVTKRLEKFDAYSASEKIESFLDDFSLWYIRRSRERVGPAARSFKDKEAFYNTCYQVLVSLTKILAPFNPFISEVIYKNLTKEESVHLANWPIEKIVVKKTDERILSDMAIARGLVERIHSARKELKLPVRQPLNSATIATNEKYEFGKDILDLVKDEVNIKDIKFTKGEERVVLDTKLTPGLIEEAKSRELIRQIQEERKKQGLSLTQFANVTSPWIPSDKLLVKKILAKTLSKSLTKADKLKVITS
jgi:isoleucyl-tRNA synthetase